MFEKGLEFRIRDELSDTLKLAWPIVLNQVGHMFMGLVDTLVAGRISTTALAGLALSANCFSTFTSVCIGCLLALDTYFSQAVGAKDAEALGRYFQQSFWSAAFMTIFSALCIGVGALLYRYLAPPSEIRDAFMVYIQNILWCVPSIFFYTIMLRYWQARHSVLPFTLIILAANVLNFFGCTALGLGAWGFPKLGIRGIAIATVVCRYAMLAAAAIYTWKHLRPQRARFSPINWKIQRQFAVLGVPAAGHTALEIGVFTIATFVAAGLGAVALAAHHVSLIMAAFTFMFPLGFSSAAAVRVGMFIGAGQPERARLAGWLCILISVAVMSLFAVGYLALPRFLLGCFTRDAAVIATGAKLLVLVALFQVADGTQVSTTGALRGLGNTRSAMIANLIGHYPVGLMLGLVLCFPFQFGVVGLWTGLASGLVAVGGMLLLKWREATRDLTKLRRIME